MLSANAQSVGLGVVSVVVVVSLRVTSPYGHSKQIGVTGLRALIGNWRCAKDRTDGLVKVLLSSNAWEIV